MTSTPARTSSRSTWATSGASWPWTGVPRRSRRCARSATASPSGEGLPQPALAPDRADRRGGGARCLGGPPFPSPPPPPPPPPTPPAAAQPGQQIDRELSADATAFAQAGVPDGLPDGAAVEQAAQKYINGQPFHAS